DAAEQTLTLLLAGLRATRLRERPLSCLRDLAQKPKERAIIRRHENTKEPVDFPVLTRQEIDSRALMIICLCVTQNRPQFMPWLLWCYDRQTWQDKELVIIDSSREPLTSMRPDVRVVPAAPGTGIMAKRGTAFREMRGDALAWFDDDDWQHPERLERIAGALAAGALMAGGT